MRRPVLTVLLGAFACWVAACGSSASGTCNETTGVGRVAVATSAAPQLTLTGSAWCGAGPVELIAVRVSQTGDAVGPSIAKGEYVVLWSTDARSFDEQIPFDRSVMLQDGQRADLSSGAWMIGFRQNGAGAFEPMPQPWP